MLDVMAPFLYCPLFLIVSVSLYKRRMCYKLS